MNTLFVTPRLPRADDPMAARQWHLLRMLREQGFEVNLLWLMMPDAASADVTPLEAMGVRVKRIVGQPDHRLGSGRQRQPMPQPQLTAAAEELVADAALVVCGDALCHVYVRDLLWPMSRPPFCLVDLAEPESSRLMTQARSTSAFRAWKLRARAEALRHVEGSAAFQADLVLVSNMVDLEMLAQRAADANLWVVADGIDAPPAQAPPLDGHGILLAADLAQIAHQQAGAWFVREVMPRVRREVSDAVAHVRAPRLPWSLRRASASGVLQWHRGGDEPAAVRTLAGQCGVCVAPERQARGAADTVLHAMAMGRPVVCTRAVATTLPMEVGAAPVIADRADELASALVTLMRDRHEAARIGDKGQRLVREHATWSAQWSRVGALLAELAAQRSPRIASDHHPARPVPAADSVVI